MQLRIHWGLVQMGLMQMPQNILTVDTRDQQELKLWPNLGTSFQIAFGTAECVCLLQHAKQGRAIFSPAWKGNRRTETPTPTSVKMSARMALLAPFSSSK
ncbi:hypothetical protein AV530_017693 [Patagioenas fasciata monilis]|uniref:Uncharacterized protein n=1 Tax=Patagioenas fasciata monilis TaxID=372326 RepID=A0A1V4KV88_PATFA|nr:hypothetical protein AV530_017693 [Patagioenas fasciata monilis]